MLKTIKRTKQMRLDELIRYVWDNLDDLFNGYGALLFYSRDDKGVTFDEAGLVECDDGVDKDDLFEVEIEEKITEDTEFESAVTVLRDKFGLISIGYNNGLTTSIKKTIENFEKMNYKPLSIYALIDGKLEFIWEADND